MDIVVHEESAEAVLQHPMVKGLLESVSDGAIAIDANDRRILAMNQHARKLLGYEKEQVIGCQCRSMMNSPDCSRACPLTAALEGRTKRQLDLYYRGRDGRAMLHAHTRMLLVRNQNGDPLLGVELFRDLRAEKKLIKALSERRSLKGIIGAAPAMQSLYDLVQRLAAYPIPVLITGESGVGKERFAAAIHQTSSRAKEPFVTLNCATLSPDLVASELFGHKRGAFTGAISDRRGYFEEAHGGTLFLDEIGELAPSLQAKLLRVLQEGEIQRLGEERIRKVDVRIIAATNRDLQAEVSAGTFRNDLFYRLSGARLQIPPLRERREDISLLAEHFFKQFQKTMNAPALKLTTPALQALTKHDWPGNVRELENVLRMAVVFAGTGPEVQPQHLQLPQDIVFKAPADAKVLPLKDLERQAIETALSQTNGNMSQAAKLLGVDRTTLWRKVNRW